MIDGWTQTMGAMPLLGIAAAAIALILVLVIVFKLHAFLTLVLVSLATAFATGIPAGEIVPILTSSFGNTLGSVALLVGLGAMLGKLIEYSGGAQAPADRLISLFGESRAPLALGVASLLMASRCSSTPAWWSCCRSSSPSPPVSAGPCCAMPSRLPSPSR